MIPWAIGFVVLVAGIITLMARQQKTRLYQAYRSAQIVQKQQVQIAKKNSLMLNSVESTRLKTNLILHTILLIAVLTCLALEVPIHQNAKTLMTFPQTSLIIGGLGTLIFLSYSILLILEVYWDVYKGSPTYQNKWLASLAFRVLTIIVMAVLIQTLVADLELNFSWHFFTAFMGISLQIAYFLAVPISLILLVIRLVRFK